MREFNDTETRQVVLEGGIYEGKRFGSNSPNETYFEAGLYLLVDGTKPSYDNTVEKLVSEYVDDEETSTTTKDYTVTALSQEEIDAIAEETLLSQQAEGEKILAQDSARRNVGSPPLIEDKEEFDVYMQEIYAQTDVPADHEVEGNSQTARRGQSADSITLAKPPKDLRQHMTIAYETVDPFTFIRSEDSQWGWMWRVDITTEDNTNLAVAIYDAEGNYLYTTGEMILDEGTGTYYSICPAGQATVKIEDVYFQFLLGSGPISDMHVYRKEMETLSLKVRYDKRYD